MELDFTSFDENFNHYEEVFLSLLKSTLNHLSLSIDPIISVSLIDDKTIHEINKNYRHVDRATDVISFAFLDGLGNKDELLSSNDVIDLGEIYISLDRAKKQAEEYQHSLHRELCFLFVHGLLHLLGYDHMNKMDEEKMFALQEEILSTEGVKR